MNDTTPPPAASPRSEIARRGFRRGLLAAARGRRTGPRGLLDGRRSTQLERLGLPEPAGDRAPVHPQSVDRHLDRGRHHRRRHVGPDLWASTRYRTHHNEMPRQSRYNLPMEIFYTLAPFVIIGVLFYYTILAQNSVQAKVPDPDVTIDVVGQKWSWTFNYKEADNPAVGSDVWEAGTISKTPDLYLPVNKSVHFNLSSPDVIHSFWIPSFYMKLDVVPGRHNNFYVTPTKEGVFAGKCAELCGTYHSAMLFNVHIVSEDEYNAYLKTLVAKGQTGEAKGAAMANSNAQVRQIRGGHAMTTMDRTINAAEIAIPKRRLGTIAWKWMITTDHKVIGNLYFITSMLFFLFGGILALAHPRRAGLPGAAVPLLRDLQPVLHHARHDHAAAVRDAAVRRLRQRDHAAADRLARRRVPAAEHVLLLAVPVRRADHRLRLPVARRVRRASAGSRTPR